MKILVISDVESKYLWDYFDKEKFKGVDLIVSCGDLSPEYLTFLTTMTSIPLLYVYGNHDDVYKYNPPEGCICIKDEIYEFNGVRFLGLGGSKRYKPGDHQYTERDMVWRIRKLRRKLLKSDGFDVLVTHSPAAGHGDGDDLPHQGFKVFEKLMDEYKPKYMLHGHMHLNYGPNMKRVSKYKNTTIINGYERYIFDYEDGSH